MDCDLNYTYTLKEVEPLASLITTKIHEVQILAIFGDIGTGKTTLTKQIIHKKIGYNTQDITSPTYNYVNIYQNDGFCIHHFDLYRLNSLKQFDALGLNEQLQQADLNIIEWPSILEPRFNNYSVVKLHLKHINQNKRQLLMHYHGAPLAL